jgi:hypothetical protein
MTDLLPCYCGETAYLAGPRNDGGHPDWFVFCGRAICYLRTGLFNTPEAAIAHWNALPRTERSAALAFLEGACRSVRNADAERDQLRELLKRIRGWDHLDSAGDGPYWKSEIDKVLK